MPKDKGGNSKATATGGLVRKVDDDDYDQPLVNPITPDFKKIKTSVPFDGGKYTTYLCHEPCKEESIILCHAENAEGDATYQKAIKDQVAENPFEMRDRLHLVLLLERRDTRHPQFNVAMPQSREGKGKDYAFIVFLLSRDEEKTIEESLKEFVVAYQDLMNENDNWKGTSNKVVFVPTCLRPQPVRHWLLDKDMLRVMKMIYGHGGKTTKRDLMHSPDILRKFFATVEEGREYLSPHSEEQWQSVRV